MHGIKAANQNQGENPIKRSAVMPKATAKKTLSKGWYKGGDLFTGGPSR